MSRPEVWLRGPRPGIPTLLQPLAHSLLQAREDVGAILSTLSPDELWRSPGGAATAGFHVRHATGSLDRLLTYARGEPLTDEQRDALAAEREPGAAPDTAAHLLAHFERTVDAAIAQLGATDAETLLDARSVGRAGLPSTVLGLLFHAAEHTQRHAGQLVTTAKIVKAVERP